VHATVAEQIWQVPSVPTGSVTVATQTEPSAVHGESAKASVVSQAKAVLVLLEQIPCESPEVGHWLVSATRHCVAPSVQGAQARVETSQYPVTSRQSALVAHVLAAASQVPERVGATAAVSNVHSFSTGQATPPVKFSTFFLCAGVHGLTTAFAFAMFSEVAIVVTKVSAGVAGSAVGVAAGVSGSAVGVTAGSASRLFSSKYNYFTLGSKDLGSVKIVRTLVDQYPRANATAINMKNTPIMFLVEAFARPFIQKHIMFSSFFGSGFGVSLTGVFTLSYTGIGSSRGFVTKGSAFY
jgi:hypothetical protein